MTTGLLQMVEMTGVEPVSESTSSEPSPGADDDLHSLARAHTVMLQGLVASLCVTRAKLSVFTFTTHRRPIPGRGPPGWNARYLSSEKNSIIVVL